MANDHTYDFSTDLNNLTRDALENTRIKQVFLRDPLLARLMLDRRVMMSGGRQLALVVKYKQGTDDTSSYAKGDQLTSTEVNRRTTLRMPWKLWHTSIRWDVEDMVANVHGSNEAKVADIVKEKVMDAHDSSKDKLQEWMYTASTVETGKDPQSIQTALTHDRTYGGLTRATTVTNEWLQGASPAGSYTDQATAVLANIPNFRKWRDQCDRYNDRPGSTKLVVVGDPLYRKFLADSESRDVNTSGPGPTSRFGHESVVIDGVEFLKSKYLGADSTRDGYFFYLDTSTWRFETDKVRNFMMTNATNQSIMDGGVDRWVQRILTAGRFVSEQPNANMYLSNVS